MTRTRSAGRGHAQQRGGGDEQRGGGREQRGGGDQRPGGPPRRSTGGPPAPAASRTSAAERLVAEWGPTAARLLLGLVLAWFGYHELVQPSLWTGYVPVVSAASSLAVLLVLAHGWLLLLLAVAIVAGVAHRSASVVAALLMLEIVISLTVTGGVSDLTMRDVGVLGLAICLAAGTRQRLLLSR